MSASAASKTLAVSAQPLPAFLAKCGAKGASITTRSRTIARSRQPASFMWLTSSISAAMAVL